METDIFFLFKVLATGLDHCEHVRNDFLPPKSSSFSVDENMQNYYKITMVHTLQVKLGLAEMAVSTPGNRQDGFQERS